MVGRERHTENDREENGSRRLKCLSGSQDGESRKAGTFFSTNNRKVKTQRKRIGHIADETTFSFKLIIFEVCGVV